MNLKREIIVVFHPYVKPGTKRPFRYRVISVNSLGQYIGDWKAKIEVEKFINSDLDKTNFYVSLKGMVYFYRK